MEIALNKESKRKTPAYISFRDGDRTFGEDAQNVAVKFPSKGYGYLLDLLGKKIDNPIVQLFQKRFPWYNIVADPERGTVVFQHDRYLLSTEDSRWLYSAVALTLVFLHLWVQKNFTFPYSYLLTYF